MENSISTMLLLIATLVIGIVATGLAAFYASNQYNISSLQSQAENIANGLYISVGNTVNTTVNTQTTFVTVYDFSYQGQLYFTAFYVPSVIKNSSSEITPQFAYTVNGQIVYPEVTVGNSIPPNLSVNILYYTDLNLMYQGSPVTLWQTPSLTSPLEISLTMSPPQGYSVILLFFAKIQNKYIEVGYILL